MLVSSKYSLLAVAAYVDVIILFSRVVAALVPVHTVLRSRGDTCFVWSGTLKMNLTRAENASACGHKGALKKALTCAEKTSACGRQGRGDWCGNERSGGDADRLHAVAAAHAEWRWRLLRPHRRPRALQWPQGRLPGP
jgi:hypothetical protein